MPVDPYEQLDSIFTDIADAIRSHGGGGYEEEVTTNSAELQTILENNTYNRAVGTGQLMNNLKTKQYKCLMIEIGDVYTYEGNLVLIEGTDGEDINESDISIIQTEDSPSNVVITDLVQKNMTIRVYGTNRNGLWNNEAESPSYIAYQGSKTFTAHYLQKYVPFSNTIQVPIASDICPLDFARRVSSSITERSKPSLNAIFTDVANAIRYEQGTSASIAVSDMPTLIRNL